MPIETPTDTPNAPERAPGQRPAHVKAPAHWSKSEPVPEPRASDDAPDPDRALAPTRYGDWERAGIAIDF